MLSGRNVSALLTVAAALALFALVPRSAEAHGGHGSRHHSGSHHGGGHHGGHVAHHPYHHSSHHAKHHATHHRHNKGRHGNHRHADAHRYRHHHHSWHRDAWGPGFWGGAGLGYGLAYATGAWGNGGNTYVDNSTTVVPGADDTLDSGDGSDSTDDGSAPGADFGGGFGVDDWPELGVATYAGQYGGSQGLVIVRVVPNSAADEAGAVPGDVILSVNGQPVPSADALEGVLDGANGKFQLEVWDARTGRKSMLSGRLDPPAADATATTGPAVQP